MSFTAAIDISTFIWSEEDFNTNRNQYYNLLMIAPSIYDKIRELKLPVLLRTELLELIMGEFPHNMVNEISSEFGGMTLSFLTNTNWFSYTDNNDSTIDSTPEITKPHFSNNIQIESQSQKCHLFHSQQNPEHKFIAYNYFFNSENNIILNKQDDKVEVETLRYSTEKEIEDFFTKFKIKFEHNTKHRKEAYYDYERSENVSSFSCYHNQGQLAAQKLLDNAILHKSHYYNYDLNNNVFVRFIKTRDSIYHGHDLSDEGTNIPNEVKKKLHK